MYLFLQRSYFKAVFDDGMFKSAIQRIFLVGVEAWLAPVRTSARVFPSQRGSFPWLWSPRLTGPAGEFYFTITGSAEKSPI